MAASVRGSMEVRTLWFAFCRAGRAKRYALWLPVRHPAARADPSDFFRLTTLVGGRVVHVGVIARAPLVELGARLSLTAAVAFASTRAVLEVLEAPPVLAQRGALAVDVPPSWSVSCSFADFFPRPNLPPTTQCAEASGRRVVFSWATLAARTLVAPYMVSFRLTNGGEGGEAVARWIAPESTTTQQSNTFWRRKYLLLHRIGRKICDEEIYLASQKYWQRRKCL